VDRWLAQQVQSSYSCLVLSALRLCVMGCDAMQSGRWLLAVRGTLPQYLDIGSERWRQQFFWNIGNNLPCCVASHLRRKQSRRRPLSALRVHMPVLMLFASLHVIKAGGVAEAKEQRRHINYWVVKAVDTLHYFWICNRRKYIKKNGNLYYGNMSGTPIENSSRISHHLL
jgi:hypothetical protein